MSRLRRQSALETRVSVVNPPDGPEASRSTVLDTIVKYAAILTWFVYAAGLARMSGYLHRLNIPTEPSFFAVSTVFSYGGTTLGMIALRAVVALAIMKWLEDESPIFAKCIGWLLPALWFLVQERYLFDMKSPLPVRVFYVLSVLAVMYLCIAIVRYHRSFIASPTIQVAVALCLLVAVDMAAGYTGELDAYACRDTNPSIQLLIAQDAVPAVSQMGLTFSGSVPGLSDPVNVVAASEKLYYVWLPSKLTTENIGGSVRLMWGNTTIAIPRDKVLALANRSNF